MRFDNYDWVLGGWNPDGWVPQRTGWSFTVYLGLPYVEFHVSSDRGYVSVRCDPCSSEAAKAGYALMVRADLESAMARLERKQLQQHI